MNRAFDAMEEVIANERRQKLLCRIVVYGFLAFMALELTR